MVTTTDEICDNNEVCAAEVQAAPLAEAVITEEDFEKAQKTFQMGKKNLFLNKYDESVNNIDEACKIYSSKYGELGPQCAEVYFFYGRALLELARVENTVLGNALNGVPEDTGPIDDSRYGNPEELAAEEKNEISEKVIDALCQSEEEKKSEEQTAVEPAKEGEAKVEVTTTDAVTVAPTETTEVKKPEEEVTAEKPSETVEATVEKKEGETAAAAEGEEEGDEEGDEEDEEEGEDLTKNDEQVKDEAEAEEISNLQRSWEMFELAKVIYSKNFDNDLAFKNKRIAECLLKLGEISIEQEIYEQAITDISESVKLQEEQEKENRDERMLAESFYQLGLAQQFNNLFTEANESYQKSINIMQLRVEKLKGKLATITGEDADAELEKTTLKDEITELEGLLPEMISKLEEVTTEQGQQSLNLIKEAKECFLNAVASDGERPATNGEVKDITSMVKSKRKISDESPQADQQNGSMKKTKLGDSETEAAPVAETEAKIDVDEAVKPVEETKVAEQPIAAAPAEITA